jgi:hypothetical protein
MNAKPPQNNDNWEIEPAPKPRGFDWLPAVDILSQRVMLGAVLAFSLYAVPKDGLVGFAEKAILILCPSPFSLVTKRESK